MGATRIAIVLLIAGIVAIGLGFLVNGMMKPPPPAPVAAAPPPPKPMAQVLIAKKDLPIGWRITTADLSWQAWPVDALNATFITDGSAPAPKSTGAGKVAEDASRAANNLVMGANPMQSFEGAIVKEAIAGGEPITARKIARAGQTGYLAVVLQPGMRAMAIPVTTETGAGGFILPGDRVDVLQARAGEQNKGFVTETLMQNLRVLAIDQTTESKDAKAVVGAVATLEVPAADAEVLARGKAQGEMILALRSYADVGGRSGRGDGQSDDKLVRVSRGGEISEVSVQ
jgi:pilus assembly protein CpaB